MRPWGITPHICFVAIHPEETPAEHIRNVLQLLVTPAERVTAGDAPALLVFPATTVETMCARLMEALAKIEGLAALRH